MKKNKSLSTKEIILELALKDFNERGLNFVGIRELAKKLNLSPGNVSYYFPKKDDLIEELVKQLNLSNSKLFEKMRDESLDFEKLFANQRLIMQNQYKYRFIFLSFVALVENHKSLVAWYDGVFRKRLDNLAKMLDRLEKNDLLRADLSIREKNRIISNWSFTSRFCYSEAAVSLRGKTESEIFDHYIELLAGTFLPYCTQKGEEQLEAVISGIQYVPL